MRNILKQKERATELREYYSGLGVYAAKSNRPSFIVDDLKRKTVEADHLEDIYQKYIDNILSFGGDDFEEL